MLLGPYGTGDTQATMVVRETSKVAPLMPREPGEDKESNLGCVHNLTAGQSPGSCHLFFYLKIHIGFPTSARGGDYEMKGIGAEVIAQW